MRDGTEILVMGAGGYIGGRLVPLLLAKGHGVRTVSREPVAFEGADDLRIDLAGDPGPVQDICSGATTIVHLAGQNEVVAAQDPTLAFTETTLATQRIAEAAEASGVRRIVYLSTVHVYGRQMREGAVLTEELRPEPTAVYAISRLASEHLLSGLVERGVEIVVLRLTNSVGAPSHPGVDRWSLVVNDLCRQGAVSGRLELRTAGVQWRDFVALTDVCQIIGAACQTNGDAVVPGGTYNLGSGTHATIRDVAALVQDAFEGQSGVRPPLEAPDPPASRPGPYDVAVDRLAEHGLRALTPLKEAVEETARFCLEHREELGRKGAGDG